MKKSFKQWATLIAICMAGGTIFKLAYLRDVFYVAMQEPSASPTPSSA
ncbi:hypothetical protein [Enterocloster asparagiformis]|nr:hypothetical protein [Enterocloster asparagiformis]